MCCFAGPVEKVENTKIYVAPDSTRTRQIVVYEMDVRLKIGVPGNAMILPCPAPAKTIRLIDMTGQEHFFSRLNRIFEPPSRGRSLNSAAAAGGYLEVQDVGSYRVSIAPSIDDIARLDPAVFSLSPETRAALAASQGGSNFSFVVAVLRKSGEYHPLAYSHDIVGDLFVPTRHEHGNSIEKVEGGKIESKFADWDHEIYYQGEGHLNPLVSRSATFETIRAEHAKWDYDYIHRHLDGASAEVGFFIDSSLPISRMRLKGRGLNVDTSVQVAV